MAAKSRPTAVVQTPAPLQHLQEPQHYCTSTVLPGTLAIDLKGWAQGLTTWGDWLDAGGPLDATDHLPIGGAFSHDLTFATLLRFSQSRPGAVA